MRLLSIKESDIKEAEPKGKDSIRLTVTGFLSRFNFEFSQENSYAAFLLCKSGLDNPVLEITKAPNAYPRAYLKFADFYYDQDGHYGIPKGHFYVSIPDGYNNNGKNIKPSVPFETVHPTVADVFYTHWYGGGWGNGGPSFWLKSIGTDIPKNFHSDDTVNNITIYDPQVVFIVPRGSQSLAGDFAQASSRIIGAEYNGVKLYSIPKNEIIPDFLKKYPQLGVRTYKWLEEDASDFAYPLPTMPEAVKAELIAKRIIGGDDDITSLRLMRMPKLF